MSETQTAGRCPGKATHEVRTPMHQTGPTPCCATCCEAVEGQAAAAGQWIQVRRLGPGITGQCEMIVPGAELARRRFRRDDEPPAGARAS